MSAPRLVSWPAVATEEAVAEMHRIRATGAVLVPRRDGGTGVPTLAPPLSGGSLPEGSVIVRTSGSTGRPRDIVIGAPAFAASARAVAERLDLRATDVWWASLSPAHVGGIALLLRARHLGCEIVCTGGFDARVFLELCATRRITHASFVPTMLRRVLEIAPEGQDFSSLRALLIGGAAADPGLLRRAVEAGIPVVTTWGMTEAASQVATATPAETAADPTHAGRTLDGVEVRTDANGRLQLRTPTLALGELVEGRLVPLVGPDGWYATDDLGHVDEGGFVRITGRVSDRIISGGVNVDPLEVEGSIRRMEGVEEVVVVGLPDPEWGERVVAVVVARPDDPRSGAELLAALPAGLRGARRPKAVVRVEALPLNPNGKVDRAAARDLAAG
jgi:O-succinylbenzoic acid--CoA ligase